MSDSHSGRSARVDVACPASAHCRSYLRRLDAGDALAPGRALWLHIGPIATGSSVVRFHDLDGTPDESTPRHGTIELPARYDAFVGYSLDVLAFCARPSGVPSKLEAFTLDATRRTLYVVRKIAWLDPGGAFVRLDVGSKLSEHHALPERHADKSTLYICRALVNDGRFPVGHPPVYREPEGLVKARQAVALYYDGDVGTWDDAAHVVGIVERHIGRLRKRLDLDSEYERLPRDLDNGRVLASARDEWIEHGTVPSIGQPEVAIRDDFRGYRRVFLTHSLPHERDIFDTGQRRRSS